MAINFPDSPTLNQVFSAGGRTWRWDGTTWVSVGAELVVADITDLTATATEINYTDGVTSAIQTQIDSKAATSALAAKADLAGAAFTGNISTTGTITAFPAPGIAANSADRVGYIGIPSSGAGVSGAYTLVATDAGELVYTTTSRTVTIPANASVPFQAGTTIVFISGPSATTTISINSDTLRLAGGTSTGSRTLAANGMATAVKVDATNWYISGNGLT
jgi:hypothetical protein